jgi:hypothetical protein
MSSITTVCSVYEGRQCLAFILHHLDESGLAFEVIDTANRKRGVFATYQEARAAALALPAPPTASSKPATTTPDKKSSQT